MNEPHLPVCVARCVELLAPALRDGGTVVDATLGAGGHTRAILERFPAVRVIGIDRDPEALALASARLVAFADRFLAVAAVYDTLDEVLAAHGMPRPLGILFDLGVSSMQLDDPERGFAYARDAPLDMRMNPTDEYTAADVLAASTVDELRRIFLQYGQEPLAARYARAIAAAREVAPITRSGALVAVLQEATPAAVARRGHPAKRVFQALRIAVNEELVVLERAVPTALSALAPGGRLIALSYHSLEDRIVKEHFARVTRSTAPPGLPIELPEHRPRFRLAVRGCEAASDEEQTTNPRSRSVRLRAIERNAA